MMLPGQVLSVGKEAALPLGEDVEELELLGRAVVQEGPVSGEGDRRRPSLVLGEGCSWRRRRPYSGEKS